MSYLVPVDIFEELLLHHVLYRNAQVWIDVEDALEKISGVLIDVSWKLHISCNRLFLNAHWVVDVFKRQLLLEHLAK
jgi:hypothetical protein